MGLKDQIEQEVGPKRDRWGRPLLVPATGLYEVDKEGRTWYSRASSLSDFASGVKTGLETWKRRHTAVGIARREDIAAMIAALPPTETGDKKDDAVTKAQLDEYIEEAMIASGASAKANWGTAVHGFTTDDVDASHAPERMRADIEAYQRELGRLGIEPVLDEVFVASDFLRAAGTFDHLYRLPDGRVVIGDKKTGIDSPLDAAIQMAVYADGAVYDWLTDERESLADVAGSFGTFDRTIGLHVSIPRGEGTCTVKALDLDYGFELAEHCAALRDAGHAAKRDLLIATSPEGLLLERIWSASSRDELQDIMTGVTSEDALEVARKKWAELTD